MPMPPRAQSAGFTLVELLAVLAVIGIAGAAVALTLPDDSSALDREAARFGARLMHAQEEAILGTRAIEVTANSAGYGFTRQDFDRWQPLDERPFDTMLWASGTTARLPRGQEQVTFHFDPAGAASEQSLTLQHGESVRRVAVDSAGEVLIDAPR